MTKILITGGSSYLGRHLVPLALAAGHTIYYTYFQNDPLNLDNGHRLDLRDETAVSTLIHKLSPQLIIHLAGSNRPDDMAAVIQQGTQAILNAVGNTAVRLIHLSTDSVFDGTAAPYTEDDVPTPINEYGRAKAIAEQIVRTHPNHVIIRTSLIYGLHEMDHGTAWMSAALQAGKPVTLFTNQIRNPIWVRTLCQSILELSDARFRGILNIAGKQDLTRAQFAIKMLDLWRIQKRDSLSFAQSPPQLWPLDCRLNLQKATAILNTPLLGVDEVLKNTEQ